MGSFSNIQPANEPLIIPQQLTLDGFHTDNTRTHLDVNRAPSFGNNLIGSQFDINKDRPFSPYIQQVSQSNLQQQMGKLQSLDYMQQRNEEKTQINSSLQEPQQFIPHNMHIGPNERSETFSGSPSQQGNMNQQQNRWVLSQHDTANRSSTLTPQVAAAIMGNRENVSQRQMAQLKQLQATYGTIQTNLSKKNENDEHEKVHSISGSLSPNIIQQEHINSKNQSFIVNSTNFNSQQMFKNNNLVEQGQSPTSMITTPADGQQSMRNLQFLNQTIPSQNSQRKTSIKPQPFSSQSSQVTTPFQDSISHTPVKQTFNITSQAPLPNQNITQPPSYQLQNSSQMHQAQQYPSNTQINQSLNSNSSLKQRTPQIPHQQYPEYYPIHGPAAGQGQGRPLASDLNGAPKDEIKRNLSNITIVRFLKFNDALTCRHEKPSLPYLRQIVNEFFCNDATIDISMRLGNDNRNFKFAYNLIPMLYHKYLENVQMFELTQKFIDVEVLPNGCTMLTTDHCSFKSVFEDGSYCNHFGALKIKMDSNLMFEKVELVTDYNVFGLEFAALEKYLNYFSTINNSLPLSNQVKSHFRCINGLNKFGIQEGLLRLMQIGDVMSLTKPLIHFYMDSNLKSPLEALEVFNKVNNTAYQKLRGIYSKNNNGNQTIPPEVNGMGVVTGVPEKMERNYNQKDVKFPNKETTNQQILFMTPQSIPTNQTIPQPNLNQYSGQMSPNQAQFPQQNGLLPARVRSHQNSVASIQTTKSMGSFANQLGFDTTTTSVIPSPDSISLTNMHNNQSSVPLKRSSSDSCTVQIVTKKNHKKFKLKSPVVPTKSLKKRKNTDGEAGVKKKRNHDEKDIPVKKELDLTKKDDKNSPQNESKENDNDKQSELDKVDVIDFFDTGLNMTGMDSATNGNQKADVVGSLDNGEKV